jgi:hypothetical protein
MTATFPLPFAASCFSFVIAEKVLVRDDVESAGTFTEPPLEVPFDEGPLLPHAARKSPTATATAIVTLFLVVRFK